MPDEARNDVLRSVLEVARATSELGGASSIAEALAEAVAAYVIAELDFRVSTNAD